MTEVPLTRKWALSVTFRTPGKVFDVRFANVCDYELNEHSCVTSTAPWLL
jgi:hypothetical protein